jgi:hypothetical protein
VQLPSRLTATPLHHDVKWHPMAQSRTLRGFTLADWARTLQFEDMCRSWTCRLHHIAKSEAPPQVNGKYEHVSAAPLQLTGTR